IEVGKDVFMLKTAGKLRAAGENVRSVASIEQAVDGRRAGKRVCLAGNRSRMNQRGVRHFESSGLPRRLLARSAQMFPVHLLEEIDRRGLEAGDRSGSQVLGCADRASAGRFGRGDRLRTALAERWDSPICLFQEQRVELHVDSPLAER